MKRREFITLVGGAAAWPLAARAQQDGRIRRIGVLSGYSQNDREGQARVAAFLDTFRKLGWADGRNVAIEYRWAAQDIERAKTMAAELLRQASDVILVNASVALAELQRQTSTVPIVFVQVSDSVGSGFVAGLARPGGNLTGVLQYEAGIAGKWLSMLKEIAPALARAALLCNPSTTAYDYWLRAARTAAHTLAVELVPAPVVSAADMEQAIAGFAQVPNGALLLPPDATTIIHRDVIIALAARHRLPAVYALRVFVSAGGLMAYGTNQVEQFRQAASYVDRILRGAKPADLPVQVPTKYETTLNLKAAKAIGLEVPASLLVRADEVIE
jgi:putative tryptophan/tyrosine transport system substrate-binding protein